MSSATLTLSQALTKANTEDIVLALLLVEVSEPDITGSENMPATADADSNFLDGDLQVGDDLRIAQLERHDTAEGLMRLRRVGGAFRDYWNEGGADDAGVDPVYDADDIRLYVQVDATTDYELTHVASGGGFSNWNTDDTTARQAVMDLADGDCIIFRITTPSTAVQNTDIPESTVSSGDGDLPALTADLVPLQNTDVPESTVASGDADLPAVTADLVPLENTDIPETVVASGAADLPAVTMDTVEPAMQTAQAITSSPAAASNTYGANERIQFTVTFDGAVDVTGTPQYPINLGQSPAGNPELADYLSGSGTTQLVFQWIVSESDEDTNGIFLFNGSRSDTHSLTLNGGTIYNAETEIPASTRLPTSGGGTQGGHRVDGSLQATTDIPETEVASGAADLPALTADLVPLQPAEVTLTAITSTPEATSDTYGRNETIQITVTYDQAVVVTGTPQFPFSIDTPSAVVEMADYVSGSGSTSLVFEYTVLEGDSDDNGIRLYGGNGGDIALNGGTIRNQQGDFDADLETTNAGTYADHKVDGSLLVSRDIAETVLASGAADLPATTADLVPVQNTDIPETTVASGPGDLPALTADLVSVTATDIPETTVSSGPGAHSATLTLDVTIDAPELIASSGPGALPAVAAELAPLASSDITETTVASAAADLPAVTMEVTPVTDIPETVLSSGSGSGSVVLQLAAVFASDVPLVVKPVTVESTVRPTVGYTVRPLPADAV